MRLLSRSLSSSSSSSAAAVQSLLKRGFTPTLKSVNLFLLSLSRARKYDLVANFFSQLDRNHVSSNSQTHSIFTWALLKLNRLEEAEQFLKTQMAVSSNFKKDFIFDSLIQGFCIHRKDPEKALSLLQDCLRSHGILPSYFTFCSLIHSFSSQGKMSGAIQVLELMNQNEGGKYPFDNFVVSSIVSGFCEVGKPELGVEFFQNALDVWGLRPNVVTYTALVNALCMLGRVGEVSELARRMDEEGVDFDVVFYSSWISGYLREGMVMDAFRKHREMMVERGIRADNISYNVLVHGVSRDGNVDKGVGFIDKMIEDGLKPDLFTCTSIVMGLCKKGKIDEAFSVFKMVDDMGIKVDEFMYATLIDGLSRRGDFDHVYQLLEEMEEKGIAPGILTYNTLINGLCKFRRTFDADEVSNRIVGDIVTYSTLLHGYIREENILGILEIKRRSEAAGVGVDTVLCTILMKAFFMMGAFEDVHSLYKEMKEMDLLIDSVTYCTMIDGYCKVGRIDEALEIFDEFRRTMVSSAACYNCMVNGLCKNGMADVATEVFVELNEKGLTLNVGMCRTLLKELANDESADGILNLIYRTERLGLDLYSTICNDAIELLCKNNLPMAAIDVYTVLRRNGLLLTSTSYCLILKELINDAKLLPAQPILGSFVKDYGLVEPRVCTMLLYYLCLNDMSRALYFLNKRKGNGSAVTLPISAVRKLAKTGRVFAAYELVMKAKDCLPSMNVVDYTILVDGLCKGGHPTKALDLCIFAESKGLSLTIVTYNSVINGLCHQGCLVEAFRLFDSLERINLTPSEITYATLIDTLCKGGHFLDAEQLFERMILKGYKANARIFNSFINGYCRFGLMEEAWKILNNMEQTCDPDEFSVSSMINGYCQTGDLEGALLFFVEYEEKGISPDLLGFLHLMRGLYTKGRMEEARSVLRKMLQSQSAMELIRRVNVVVETESIESFLFHLCEQGSIKEAVTLLDEVCALYFPARKWSDPYHEAQEHEHLSDLKAYGRVTKKAVSPSEKTDLDISLSGATKLDHAVGSSDDLAKSSQFNGIDSHYALIASFLSRGEPLRANKLVKDMIASFDGG
ncbi:hypothetical protein Tsubulata_012803 [Turnera subulata]|uniref:Pentacotripeptide-repeat region of PRORP domain-containing protein n=1 Tax=Turnera subulata TaxID=218843 RepID=A0A9Q0FFG3_9ROSI|nr:hypothetical protein Tsubulata_012803 [Turnera subulata]